MYSLPTVPVIFVSWKIKINWSHKLSMSNSGLKAYGLWKLFGSMAYGIQLIRLVKTNHTGYLNKETDILDEYELKLENGEHVWYGGYCGNCAKWSEWEEEHFCTLFIYRDCT